MLADGVEQRLIDTAIAESASGNLVEDPSQCRALLFHGDRAVHVLVAQVFHSRGQVAEEDYDSQSTLAVYIVMRMY